MTRFLIGTAVRPGAFAISLVVGLAFVIGCSKDNRARPRPGPGPPAPRPRSERQIKRSEMTAAERKNPEWKLTINGHTDNAGGDAFNLDLSKPRSAAVRSALSETCHIDPARLSTAGFGASQPKESNATVEGRAKNRRVELVRQ